MKLIAAVDEKWAIGKNTDLLVHIPEDQKNFRKLTTGHVVVLGRKTLAGFPSGKPLKDRVNIILTKNKNFNVPDAVAVHSKEELLEILKKYKTDDIYVIGGGMVYELLEPYADSAIITKIDYTYDADTFFPNLDAKENWIITGKSEEMTYFDLTYHFVTYKNQKVYKM